jgi:isocitrate dehydrogenase
VQVFEFDSAGVGMAMCNTEKSITLFAHSCFQYALQKGWPLFLSTKSTIQKNYDGKFIKVFATIYNRYYYSEFRAQGLWYEHRVIDSMVTTVRVFACMISLTRES